MIKERKLSLEKIELLLASALAFVLGVVKLSADLPYNGPCTFFFGEPEYPSDDE